MLPAQVGKVFTVRLPPPLPLHFWSKQRYTLYTLRDGLNVTASIFDTASTVNVGVMKILLRLLVQIIF